MNYEESLENDIIGWSGCSLPSINRLEITFAPMNYRLVRFIVSNSSILQWILLCYYLNASVYFGKGYSLW
jgi:hypothetical protein